MVDKHALAKLLAVKQHQAATPIGAQPNIAPVLPLPNTNPIGHSPNEMPMHQAPGPIKSIEFHSPQQFDKPPKMPHLAKMFKMKGQ